MLTIRFNRVGKKNKPYFRIVLQEHVIAPGGRHVEVLGSWDPYLKKAVLKAERIKYWISKGAQASDTAHNLFIKEGIIEGKKRSVKIPKKVEEPQANTESGQTGAEKEIKEEKKTDEKAAETVVKEEKAEVKIEEKKEEKPAENNEAKSE